MQYTSKYKGILIVGSKYKLQKGYKVVELNAFFYRLKDARKAIREALGITERYVSRTPEQMIAEILR